MRVRLERWDVDIELDVDKILWSSGGYFEEGEFVVEHGVIIAKQGRKLIVGVALENEYADVFEVDLQGIRELQKTLCVIPKL